MADEDGDENCKDMGDLGLDLAHADSPVLASSLRCSSGSSSSIKQMQLQGAEAAIASPDWRQC